MEGDLNKDVPSRERAWLDAWIAVARSSNCARIESPTSWADECLKQFDKRFPQTKEPSIGN